MKRGFFQRTCVLLLAAVACVVTMPAPATSQEPPQVDGCSATAVRGNCTKKQPVPAPGGQASDVEQGEGAGGSPKVVPASGRRTEPPPGCTWVAIPETPAARAMFPDAPSAAIFQQLHCPHLPSNSAVQNAMAGALQWSVPGEVGPSAPGALAATVYARVEAQMEAPMLASDPAPGVSSIVDTPVFVEVTNWQDEIVDSECVLGLCVTLTATPRLTFDPGDGSPAIACAPPGSRYDPEGPSLAEQAEGACAHVYRLRTGIDGRPAAWPGAVTVTWNVSWTANDPLLPGGSFDPLTFSTGLPRQVEEVSTVVVDADV